MRSLVLALVLIFPLSVHAAGLNDTGIDFCGANSSGNNKPCTGTEPAGQDKHYGRDAAAAAGQLVKIGGGEGGFDFTALDASGQPTTPTSGANPHSCVRDNVTGLVWEVKTDDGGLRDKDWTYTWYDSVHNYGGNAGTASGGTCKTSGRCDTEKYVADVNATALCGYTDWRMPTRQELQGTVHYGRYSPAIDPTYFPNTRSSYFWSGSPLDNDSFTAWDVDFSYGSAGYDGSRSFYLYVRLVRGAFMGENHQRAKSLSAARPALQASPALAGRQPLSGGRGRGRAALSALSQVRAGNRVTAAGDGDLPAGVWERREPRKPAIDRPSNIAAAAAPTSSSSLVSGVSS